MYRNRRGLHPVKSNHICTYIAEYIDEWKHLCARPGLCCDGCVFWHRVSEIAPHAQWHTTPHKAAHSRLPHMFRIWGGRQAGLLFSMLLPRSFASWTHSWWVTALSITTVWEKRHKVSEETCWAGRLLVFLSHTGRNSNKKTKSPMFLFVVSCSLTQCILLFVLLLQTCD